MQNRIKKKGCGFANAEEGLKYASNAVARAGTTPYNAPALRLSSPHSNGFCAQASPLGTACTIFSRVVV